MKLISDYRVRMTHWMYLMLLPLVIYFFTFKQFIYDLLVGGIIFIYWTFLIMFLNRYIKVWLQSQLAKLLKFDHDVYYKTLKPKIVPHKLLSAVDVQKLEGYPILLVMSLNFILVMALYALSGDSYLTKMMFGAFILSFDIHYGGISIIVKTLEYPNEKYAYNRISTKIYEGHMDGHAIS